MPSLRYQLKDSDNKKYMATVLLCSDEPILSEGLARVLVGSAEIELCAYCSTLDQIRAQLEKFQPDLLLVDLTSVMTVDALSQLRETVSQANIVLWVHSISTELALQAINLGVRGILRKSLPVETLIRCLRCVHEGELWCDRTLTESILTARRYTLTRRESQLVSLLSQGLKNKEIATALNISEGTVKVYLSRLFPKLGVKDRFELALYGLKNLKNLTPPGASLDTSTTAGGQSELPPLLEPTRFFFREHLPLKNNHAFPRA